MRIGKDAMGSGRTDNSREVLETVRDYGWCAVHVRPGEGSETGAATTASTLWEEGFEAAFSAATPRAAAPADADGYRPGYAYSIGFGLTRSGPEAAIFGLSIEQARAALWRFWDLDLDPQALTDGARLSGVLRDRTVIVRRVTAARYDSYFGTALRTYVSLAEFGRLQVIQLVYPDHAGRAPWDDGCDPRFRRAQPALYARPDFGA